ncbi:25079_t:CDS:10, partial [Dentiscutata erythropus]
RPALNDILLELKRLSKEMTPEFIINIIDDKKITQLMYEFQSFKTIVLSKSNNQLNENQEDTKQDVHNRLNEIQEDRLLSLYNYAVRLVDEEVIHLIRYSDFRQPTNKTDVPNDKKKRLWNNVLVNLCLLEDYRCDNNIVTRLLNELKPFKHNNMLEVFGLTFDDNNYYFVRGYYTTDLRSYLGQLRSNGTFLSWSDKLTLTWQVVEGLKYLHDQNIIHSELHPKNIVVYEGIPKLTNVWLSQNRNNNFSYSPPEILLPNDENKPTKLNIYSLGILMWEISSDGIEPFYQNNSIKLAIDIIKGAPIRPNCEEVLDKLRNVSLSDVYYEEKVYNTADFRMIKLKPKTADLELSLESLEWDYETLFRRRKLEADFVNYFTLNRGINIQGFDFYRAKGIVLRDNGKSILRKLNSDSPVVYIPNSTDIIWDNLRGTSLFESNSEGRMDYKELQIHFPVIIAEYTADVSDSFIKDIESALKISNKIERKKALANYFNYYGNYIVTKFTLGGKVSEIFDDVPLDKIPPLETDGELDTLGDLCDWLTRIYDLESIKVISYGKIIPSYKLLPDNLQQRLFDLTGSKPFGTPEGELVPNVPEKYKRKEFVKWIALKPKLELFLWDWFHNNSLQYGVILHESKPGHGKKAAFKFLRVPTTTEIKKVTLLLAQPRNRQEAYLLENGIILKDEDNLDLDNIPFAEYSSISRPLEDFKSAKNQPSRAIYCQIIVNMAKLSFNLTDINSLQKYSNNVNTALQTNEPYKNLCKIFGDDYGHLLPRNLTVDGAFNWSLVSSGDWTPLYKTLRKTSTVIDNIFRQYQIVFNGEELFQKDQQDIFVIKFPGILIDNNYHIFGAIVKKNESGDWIKYSYPNLLVRNKNRNVRALYGVLTVNGNNLSDILLKCKNLTSDCVLITSIVSKDNSVFYNIKPKAWAKARIIIDITKDKIEFDSKHDKDEFDDEGFDGKIDEIDDEKEQAVKDTVLKWCVIYTDRGKSMTSYVDNSQTHSWNSFGDYLADSTERQGEDDDWLFEQQPRLTLEEAIEQHKLENGDLLEAWRVFINYARRGDHIALYWIGFYLQYDILTASNLFRRGFYEEAIEEFAEEGETYLKTAMILYKKSADSGYSEAQLRYCFGLYLGQGEKWLIDAAKNKHQKAIDYCRQHHIVSPISPVLPVSSVSPASQCLLGLVTDENWCILIEYTKELETSCDVKHFDYSQFSDCKVIGRGGYSVVYSAIFEGQIYAIKSLKNNLSFDDKIFKNVKSEKLSKENSSKFITNIIDDKNIINDKKIIDDKNSINEKIIDDEKIIGDKKINKNKKITDDKKIIDNKIIIDDKKNIDEKNVDDKKNYEDLTIHRKQDVNMNKHSLYHYTTRLIGEKKIHLMRYSEFRQPTNKTDRPDETKKRLWNNVLVNLCLLEDYRCDDSIAARLLNELKQFKHNNVLEAFGLTFGLCI